MLTKFYKTDEFDIDIANKIAQVFFRFRKNSDKDDIFYECLTSYCKGLVFVFCGAECFAICQDVLMNNKPQREIIFASGPLKELKALHEFIEEDAVGTGVDKLMLMGSKAWGSVLSGYKNTHVVFEKVL